MNKTSFTYRLSALFLAVLMLFSTVGFSLDIHYCGGKVKSFALYGKAQTCKMMAQSDGPQCHKTIKKSCHQDSSKKHFSKKSCCANDTFTLQTLDDSETAQNIELLSLNLNLITVYILANYNLFSGGVSKTVYTKYLPPILHKDVLSLLQVFLI